MPDFELVSDFEPMGDQPQCCDVKSSGTVEILDALGIAQKAAGSCPGSSVPDSGGCSQP